MKLIRPLGFGELRMHLLHSMAAGTTQGALLVRVKGIMNNDMNIDRIRRCVDKIKSEHAILSACIVKQQSDYYFAHTAAPDLQYVVHKQAANSSNTWSDNLHAELDHLLNSNEQLWQLVVYTYANENITDFILVMHHAVMDAVGSEYFFDSLFTQLSSAENELAISQETTEFPIAMEADALSACDWQAFIQAQEKVRQLLGQVRLQPHLATCALTQRKTKILDGFLESSVVIQLEKFCNEQQISINSLFSTLFTRAVYEETITRNSFALFSAVSLRPLCPNAPQKAFGCYLSVMPTLHEFQRDWDLVKEAKQHKLKQHQAFMDIARWVPQSFDTATVEKMTETAAAATSFGNDLGFTYAETGLKKNYGAITIVHQYVGARRSLGNVAFILHGLKSAGALYFTLSYVEPLQDADYAQRVFRQFLALAQQICTTNTPAFEDI